MIRIDLGERGADRLFDLEHLPAIAPVPVPPDFFRFSKTTRTSTGKIAFAVSPDDDLGAVWRLAELEGRVRPRGRLSPYLESIRLALERSTP